MVEGPKRVRVGTCAWDKPWWRGVFYPADLPKTERLRFASTRLRTLEINATFHGLRQPKDFLAWHAQTPDDFVFSVKGHRGVTHDNLLRNSEKYLADFFASGVLLLKEKLGPILWQIWEGLPFDPDVVEAFLIALPHSVEEAKSLMMLHAREIDSRILDLPDRPILHAFEVRHASFDRPEFFELLRRHNVAAVVTNTPGWPEIREVTSDIVYVRLHGDAKHFPNGYDDETLEEWARAIDGWRTGSACTDGHGREVFVYFDTPNHKGISSPFDAWKLQRLLDGPEAGTLLSIQPPLF